MNDRRSEWRIMDCNIPGVVAGICLCALPFLGFWWSVRFGNGAFALEISPFTLGMYGFGQEFFSPIITAVNMAVVISIVFYGALLFVGSVLRCNPLYRNQSDRLVEMSARKPAWMIIFFVVTITIAGFAMEYSLQQTGIDITLPIIMGNAVGTLMTPNYIVNVPVSLSLSRAFWYAVIFAIIGFYSGIYQNRRLNGDSEKNGSTDVKGDEDTGDAIISDHT